MSESLTARRVRAVNTLRLAPALLIAVVALSACTGQFVYNRLDFIIPFYFGRRVALDEPQEAQLRAVVRGFTAWHRTSELRRYSEFLRELAQNAARPSTREEIDAMARRMEGFWEDLIVEILPEGAQWLQTLSPKQVDELLASFAEDDEDDYQDYCEPPPKKLVERRIKSLTRSMKQWSGSLTEEQEDVIEHTARGMKLIGCASLESRAQWRAEIRKALAERGGAAEGGDTAEGDGTAAMQDRLRALMVEPQHRWTPEYRAGFRANRSSILDMLAELDATWSDKQRQAIAKRLNDVADDLEELSAG